MRTAARLMAATAAGFALALAAALPASPARAGSDDGDALLAAAALSRTIDREIDAALAAESIAPVGPSDDAEFLRRATLDVLGVPPTEAEVRAFLSSNEPGKRAAKIEELLAHPLYGEHLGERWERLLVQGIRRYRLLDQGALRDWLAKGFQEGRGMDAIVRDVLTATGNVLEVPPVAYTVRFRDGGIPADIAGTTSRLFLGVQIQCAQCHDHPYEAWKQGDFASFAAFFNLVQPRPADPMDPRAGFVVEDPDPRRLARGRGRGGEGADIRGAVRADPKFLDGSAWKDAEGTTRRAALADWVTARSNPWFAKAMVNRVWSWMMGRGFVNPVDDFRSDNPPSHPALLDALALGFAESGHDVRFLVRAIAGSRAYQRTSRLPEKAPADEVALRRFDRLFARGPMKPLTADQVFDSVLRVTGMDDAMRSRNRNEIERAKRFLLDQFTSESADDEGNSAEAWAGTIPQGLLLMNGPLTQIGTRGGGPTGRGDRLGVLARDNSLHRILDDTKDTGARVERLYLTLLGRRPTADEASEAAAFAARGDGTRGWEDLFWALLNSSEFMSNH